NSGEKIRRRALRAFAEQRQPAIDVECVGQKRDFEAGTLRELRARFAEVDARFLKLSAAVDARERGLAAQRAAAVEREHERVGPALLGGERELFERRRRAARQRL